MTDGYNSDLTAFEYAPNQGRKSSWPVTFGVVSIILGIFGSIYAAWKLVVSLTMGKVYQITVESPDTADEATDELFRAMADSYNKWSATSAILSSTLLLLAITLFISGILLLLRKPVASPLLQIWSYGKIVASVGAVLVGFLMQQAQTKAMAASITSAAASSATSTGTSPPLGTTSAFSTGMTVMYGIFSIIGILWYCAYPIVMLIWLNREIVKADIASWRAPSAAEA